MSDTQSVTVTRTEHAHMTATNSRGDTLVFGTGSDGTFTPTELLLAALAGCTGLDVDFMTTKRVEPERFQVTATAEVVRDGEGNRLADFTVTFDIVFPDGPAGDTGRERLTSAVQRSHDRLCYVSRTIEHGATVAARFAGEL